ncbi:hypothetical protein DL762_000251 [Monosporascus cannonballus]|uniref:BZIP domain-containing protein n=1 Tax=Monosporascus cannonballus TaxID=155416 RepID=A0ABY0HL47_9PEZI|nr:hypothetical protein DL762_000251 [Monosporascus cannonballus]RYO99357.1 hypothetical protein DL763_001531 [Monosporascus cannonballus]
MPATTRSAWKRSTSNGGAANLRGSEEGGPQASDPVSGADPDSVSGVDPDVASGNDPGFATPTGPPQTSHETRASPKSRWKREKRPKTRRNNTKAVEKLYQKKRRLKKQAAKLRNTKKTDGSAAEEEEEEGAGQFSDSDFQHDLPAAEVKHSSLARSVYDISSCGGEVPSCLDILQDEYLVGHGGSSILKSSN